MLKNLSQNTCLLRKDVFPTSDRGYQVAYESLDLLCIWPLCLSTKGFFDGERDELAMKSVLPKQRAIFFGVLIACLALPMQVWGMHITEGFLPPQWCVAWGVLVIPSFIMGMWSMKRHVAENPKVKILIAMAGAFAFVLSAMKIPSVTGSCSHPTGVGFGAILFGPSLMAVLGVIVLLFQALLLAHGGMTTLGANAFSMAVIGPMVSFGLYHVCKKCNAPQWLAVFVAAAMGNLMTYITTAVQLALAFPSQVGGMSASLQKFLGIFAWTQVPLAVSEGIITVLIFNAIAAYGSEEFARLKIFNKGGMRDGQ